jgi:polyisoprenoid-binding protein YceI
MTSESWEIDPAHTEVGFTARHMVVAKVHGRFTRFQGRVVLTQKDLTPVSAEVKIEAASIDTSVADRDNHLRSEDFFDVEKHPHLTFRSKKVEGTGKNHYRVVGELTIRGVTREVVLDAEVLGRAKDPFGDERVALSAKTSIDRKEFGLTWNKLTETGGLLVSDRIDISLEVQAVNPTTQSQAA